MTSWTTHIIPTDDGWVVRQEDSNRGASTVYSTQKAAIEAARKMVKRRARSQITLHLRNGLMRTVERRGLPERPPRGPDRSTLGRKNIERAVSAIIRESLLAQ
jgi:hypothetical protein